MKKILKLLALLFVMWAIFFLSSQQSDDSINTTNSVINIIYGIYQFIVGNKGLSLEKFCEIYFDPIREIAHFSEFGLLGLITYINSKEYFQNKHVLYSIIFCIIYAISDEIHQLYVPGRYCDVLDVLVDTLGATLAILLIHLLSKKCLKK